MEAYKIDPIDDKDEVNLSWAESNLEAWRKAKSRDKAKKSEESDSVWLVSYADLMTVLVGFFALLLSISKVEEKKFEEVKQQVAEVFAGDYINPYEGLADQVKQTIVAQRMDDQVSVVADAEGVTLVFRDALFFDTGSFAVKEQAQTMLTKLVGTIKTQAKGFDVVVEGHTDNVPMKGDQFTNWELSSMRAARVVRTFIENGFDPNRLQGTGFGETRPLVPNVGLDGVAIVENQARNRRVVVKLVKQFRDEKERGDKLNAEKAAAARAATAAKAQQTAQVPATETARVPANSPASPQSQAPSAVQPPQAAPPAATGVAPLASPAQPAAPTVPK